MVKWKHVQRTVSIHVDGALVNQSQILGANRRLDVDGRILIGCPSPVFPILNLALQKNFSGCLRAVNINGRDLLSAAATKHYGTTGPSGYCLVVIMTSIHEVTLLCWQCSKIIGHDVQE